MSGRLMDLPLARATEEPLVVRRVYALAVGTGEPGMPGYDLAAADKLSAL